MKTILTFAFILVLNTLIGQWNIKYNTGNFYARSIVAIDEDTAIATGETYGTLYRTSDGGSSWYPHGTIFTSSWFVDMDFPTPMIGYASGGSYFGTHYEILAKTIDGGITWDSITANSGRFGYMISHIDFVNADTGFLAGDYSLHTTLDGGLTFDSIAEPFHQITSLSFLDENIGLVASTEYINSNEYRYYIKRTDDMGVSWTVVHDDTMMNANGLNNRQINNIEFASSSIVYAVGGNSTIMKSIDGGMTWSTSSIAPFYTNLTALSFTDVNTGYINNAGGIYKTTDGGLNWIVQGVSPTSEITQIDFASASVGYAGGQAGLYKTENGGAPVGVLDYEEQALQVYPNPARETLHIKSSHQDLGLFSLEGRLISLIGKDESSLDISQLSAGIYVLKSMTMPGITQKFVKL